MPSIHQDLGTFWTLRRLHVLMVYGEGPHISALLFLPLAILALDWALAKRTPAAYLIAALGMDAVALTNWLGSFALALAVAAYLVATSWNRTDSGWLKRWLTTAAIALLAYLIASPWIPPSTIRDIQYNAQYVVGPYAADIREVSALLSARVLAAISVQTKFVFRRWRINAAIAVLLLLTLLLGEYQCSPTNGSKLRWCLNRIGINSKWRWRFAWLRCSWSSRCSIGFPSSYACSRHCAAVVACIPLVRSDRQYAKLYFKPVDITTTVEFQTAKWLDSHFTNTRVMLPGTISYWLNAFNDTPQFGGGFDQGIVNRVQLMIALSDWRRSRSRGPSRQDLHDLVQSLRHRGARSARTKQQRNLQAIPGFRKISRIAAGS